MTGTRQQVLIHGSPINRLLPGKMRWVAEQPEYGESYIINPIKSLTHGIKGCLILEKCKNLNEIQLSKVSSFVLDTRPYWVRRYTRGGRRRPRKSSGLIFAIRLYRERQFLDIMMDFRIYGRGCALFHSAGYFESKPLNWSKDEMRQLVRELTPMSVRIRITIKELSDKLYQKTKNC